MFIAALTGVGLLTVFREDVKAILLARSSATVDQVRVASGTEGSYVSLPEVLLKAGLYNNGSFANEKGIIPAYWEGGSQNSTANGGGRATYGPCYKYTKAVDWEESIEYYNRTKRPMYNMEPITKKDSINLSGFCRPGFLIIGKLTVGTWKIS